MNTATPEQLMHELAFRNYAWNRHLGASYEQWILAIGPDAAQEFEERYQAELREAGNGN